MVVADVLDDRTDFHRDISLSDFYNHEGTDRAGPAISRPVVVAYGAGRDHGQT
jgi:hypothetical protein